jgi:hypothetical protein
MSSLDTPPAPAPQRLGEPVELPWWTVPLGLPLLGGILAALIVGAPLSGRLLLFFSSAAMLWMLLRVAVRVRSSSMQSVYISAAMALWAFAVVIWAVERFGGGAH